MSETDYYNTKKKAHNFFTFIQETLPNVCIKIILIDQLWWGWRKGGAHIGHQC